MICKNCNKNKSNSEMMTKIAICKECYNYQRREEYKDFPVINTGTKWCKVCEETKSITDFHVNRRFKKDGRESTCKKCKSHKLLSKVTPVMTCCVCGGNYPNQEMVKQLGSPINICKSCVNSRQQLRRLQVAVVSEGKKTCNSCQVSKHVNQFHIGTTYKDGRDPLCNSCRNKKNQQYDMKNRGNLSLTYWNRKAKDANRGNLQFVEGKQLMDKFFSNHEFQKCTYCNIDLTADNLTIDHEVPLSKGGKNSIKNIDFVCWVCNFLKLDKDKSDFEQLLLKYCRYILDKKEEIVKKFNSQIG
ncbi:HNH endonuclease [Sutcliffiella horikoshii]|uniref:HNH endonuclease n=1 Tax=Sutcliffiella horikoshii TaxID=79883 RepID=UPI003CF0AA5D